MAFLSPLPAPALKDPHHDRNRHRRLGIRLRPVCPGSTTCHRRLRRGALTSRFRHTKRLTFEEKEQIFQEGTQWYRLYGVSARNQPQTYPEFQRYWAEMLQRFTATPTVRYRTGYIRKGIPGPKTILAPLWKLTTAPINGYTRTMIAGTLPPHLREMCDLHWSLRRQLIFDTFAAISRALNPIVSRLPVFLLYAPWAARAWKRVGADPRTHK
ncbi:DUF2236 domain-containing protein [Mycobacteroides chelonae]|uniref:oxygenase MpaB family protein n=1 Tax=Mycobacteroides chelonae TaxID=1774 RepID=UPI00190FCB4A|nr:DUF2236 domain-containing protein [Mycobacteroides chelonae]